MDAPRLISEVRVWSLYGKKLLKRIFQLSNGEMSDFWVFGGTTNPVIIFPLTSDDKVIAVRQFRFGANDFVLELPGGVIRPGATELDTVSRELLEETGYKAIFICQTGEPVWFEPAAFTHPFIPYLASDCRKIKDPEPDKTEIIETVLVPWQDWVKMIFRGEVRDSKSITTTFLGLAALNYADVQGIFQQLQTEASF